jgi:hypothetical protein
MTRWESRVKVKRDGVNHAVNQQKGYRAIVHFKCLTSYYILIRMRGHLIYLTKSGISRPVNCSDDCNPRMYFEV